jgi:high-affinity iron transporter
MFQSFVIVLREGFEAFLVVAIILAYLLKIGLRQLGPAVYWGVAASILASAGLGYLIIKTANGPLWEGIFGLIGAVLVTTLVVHMWRTAAHMKKDVEKRLDQATSGKATPLAFLGVFLFTVLMVSREGMETAFLLMQVRDPKMITGIFLGIAGAVGMSLLWARFSYLIRLKAFFQVTSVFLLIFVFQILIYSFHELTEANVLPASEFLHEATEAVSPNSVFGRWLSLLAIAGCGLWLIGAWISERFSQKQNSSLKPSF